MLNSPAGPTAPPFDEARAHRWFAVEANNLGWDLVEKVDRSPADIERMIHAAHAACFHWSQVGTVLNALRAECLLATAYHAAGRAEAAVHHAELCLALTRNAGEAATAFDRATAFASAAAAFAAVGRQTEAADLLRDARIAADGFEDPDDRVVFDRLFPPAAKAADSKPSTETHGMILGLRSAIYPVADLAAAKAWYAELLGVAPYFDQPFYVGFSVGGFELGLVPGPHAGIAGGRPYWGVADAHAAFDRIRELGGVPHEPVTDVGDGVKVASLTDPFGNLLSIIENPHFKVDAVR